jgi:hypothetical protein
MIGNLCDMLNLFFRGADGEGRRPTINAELAERAETKYLCGFCGFCVERRDNARNDQ